VRRPPAVMACLALVFAVVAAPTPSATETPIFELHRTSDAIHLEKDKASPIFVLVIGSDIRDGNPDRGRADSLHIVAVNPKKRKGTIVGIPRDTYVPVPGRGRTKINAALFFGGPKTVVRTVKDFTHLPIHYYAVVEFSGFRKLVHRLGPLEVNVPYKLQDRFSGANFAKGKQKMLGDSALAFARARHGVPGGDFGRSSNHGRILLAALQKFRTDARDPFALVRYFDLFEAIVHSDVGIGDLLRLASIAKSLDPKNFRNVVLPGHSGSAGGSSIVLLSPGWGEMIRKIRDDAIL
jgi:polyisoprenyl-teichoic acid--peptidoglycan teichoic acid transferase